MYKKKADEAKADLLGAISLRNEMFEEKEALLSEKEDWTKERAVLIREKEEYQRESIQRARFARASCTTLQQRIAGEVQDKKMMFGVILCMLGVMVSLLFGGHLEAEVTCSWCRCMLTAPRCFCVSCSLICWTWFTRVDVL